MQCSLHLYLKTCFLQIYYFNVFSDDCLEKLWLPWNSCLCNSSCMNGSLSHTHASSLRQSLNKKTAHKNNRVNIIMFTYIQLLFKGAKIMKKGTPWTQKILSHQIGPKGPKRPKRLRWISKSGKVRKKKPTCLWQGMCIMDTTWMATAIADWIVKAHAKKNCTKAHGISNFFKNVIFIWIFILFHYKRKTCGLRNVFWNSPGSRWTELPESTWTTEGWLGNHWCYRTDALQSEEKAHGKSWYP